MDLRMKLRTEMSRGPLAEDEHSRKEIVGGGRPSAGRPPHNFFSAVVILCQTPCISVCISYGNPGWGSWHFCLHWRVVICRYENGQKTQNI